MFYGLVLNLSKPNLELLFNGPLGEWLMPGTNCKLTQLVWLTEEVSRLVIGLQWPPDCIWRCSCDLCGIPKALYFTSREAHRRKLKACSRQSHMIYQGHKGLANGKALILVDSFTGTSSCF